MSAFSQKEILHSACIASAPVGTGPIELFIRRLKAQGASSTKGYSMKTILASLLAAAIISSASSSAHSAESCPCFDVAEIEKYCLDGKTKIYQGQIEYYKHTYYSGRLIRVGIVCRTSRAPLGHILRRPIYAVHYSSPGVGTYCERSGFKKVRSNDQAAIDYPKKRHTFGKNEAARQKSCEAVLGAAASKFGIRQSTEKLGDPRK